MVNEILPNDIVVLYRLIIGPSWLYQLHADTGIPLATLHRTLKHMDDNRLVRCDKAPLFNDDRRIWYSITKDGLAYYYRYLAQLEDAVAAPSEAVSRPYIDRIAVDYRPQSGGVT